jgi:hypothetical protein
MGGRQRRLAFTTQSCLGVARQPMKVSKSTNLVPNKGLSGTSGRLRRTYKRAQCFECPKTGATTGALAMSDIPLHLQRRFEQRWAARFARPVAIGHTQKRWFEGHRQQLVSQGDAGCRGRPTKPISSADETSLKPRFCSNCTIKKSQPEPTVTS